MTLSLRDQVAPEKDISGPEEQGQAGGRDQERPDLIGASPTSVSKPELRGESVVVVKAAEHRTCYDLDRAVPPCRRGRPRASRSELGDPFDPLMRSALIVVGDVGRGGATKVVFRQKDEVVQSLPSGSASP